MHQMQQGFARLHLLAKPENTSGLHLVYKLASSDVHGGSNVTGASLVFAAWSEYECVFSQ